MRLAVVGNLSLDLVDGTPPRPGGPPFYAARLLAALGVPALIAVKCAASDRSRLLPPLEALGLAVRWQPGASTASYAFSYRGEARVMEVRSLGEPWTAEQTRVASGADWVHVGALFRGEFPPETLAALAADGARRLSFDGQGLVRAARTGPLLLEPEPELALLRHVRVLKLSEEEALALVGRLEERALSELGVPEVIVTLGSRGCLVASGGRLWEIAAGPLRGVDPTGAGDAFAAAYVVARSRRHGPRAAAERATQAVSKLLLR
ncbi:MAG TPA: PfkB family carbohydrate kinase [Gaiellaceae bacterium]